MKRLFLIFFFPLLLACDWEASDTSPTIQELELSVPLESSGINSKEVCYKDYMRASCRISTGGSGICYKIDKEFIYILTCRHVVGMKKNFIVEFWRDGKITGKYDAKLLRVYKVDAAIIMAFVKDFKTENIPVAIPISSVAPKKGDTIVSVGAPGFGWQTLFEGKVTKVRMDGDVKTDGSIRFIPPPKPGRSGSGIIQDGAIIGILWGTDTQGGYATDCRDLVDITKSQNLFFTADWCKFCKQMKPIISSLDDFNVQVINYDRNTFLAKQYGITALPAYVNKKNEVLFGVKTAEELGEFYKEEKESARSGM